MGNSQGQHSCGVGTSKDGSLPLENDKKEPHFRPLVQMLPVVFIKELANIIRKAQNLGNDSHVRKGSASALTSHEKIPYSFIRILVAEDNLVNHKVLRRLLLKMGVEQVDVVADGQAAVEQEASRQYDFVFMDVQMPIMDGIEACKVIKQRDSPQLPKIAFVKAHALKDFEDECFKAGGFDFISKPCKQENIEACFQRMSQKEESLYLTCGMVDSYTKLEQCG